MEITINIKDYVTDERITEICEDVIYSKLREETRHLNVNDVIANISYAAVAQMVDNVIGEDSQKLIAKKVPEIINNLSAYSVFRKADAWERQSSIGQDILDEEVRKAQPLIKSRVEQIIKEYDFPQLERNEIHFTIADVITDLLFREE